jgi:hypothetical protein
MTLPKKTPPVGVQRVIEEGATMKDTVPTGEFDEESPSQVGLPRERRRATRGDIDKLSGELKSSTTSFQAWATKDAEEHKQIVDNAVSNNVSVTQRMDKLTSTVEQLDDKLTSTVEQLDDKLDKQTEKHDARFDVLTNSFQVVAVESGKTSAHVQHLVAFVETNQKAQIRLATTDAELEKKDAADAKKARREVWKKALIVLITTAGAILGMLIEHYR